MPEYNICHNSMLNYFRFLVPIILLASLIFSFKSTPDYICIANSNLGNFSNNSEIMLLTEIVTLRVFKAPRMKRAHDQML